MIEPSKVLSLIRPMTYADLDTVLTWRNHLSVRSFMYTQNEISACEHLSWFERSMHDSKKHLLIYEIDHQPRGFVSFKELDNTGVVDWGFYAAPNVFKVSGRQLGIAAINHAFTEHKFHKVCGQVLEYNQRSLMLHRSLGFKQEGNLNGQHFDGKFFHKVCYFSLLRSEWQHNL